MDSVVAGLLSDYQGTKGTIAIHSYLPLWVLQPVLAASADVCQRQLLVACGLKSCMQKIHVLHHPRQLIRMPIVTLFNHAMLKYRANLQGQYSVPATGNQNCEDT